ncbi:hypothetical protein JOF56_011401 [Kibdelosporangium banguiense]|uniref:PPE family protein n=1 Tax=Kibdelosporangium banguiense TaxID=1365924 RepID=A0ABS4U493_9PSEU|nr:hypothetical protein [Kibdelosporangium banguiense]MBP2331016.1 hypothetical protein [Kibdelosporangium banguiense]
MFLSGQEIYENFSNARGSADLAGSADVVSEVVKTYNERGDQIKKLLGKMDAVWKGGAAGAAHRGVGPLALEHALAVPAIDTMRDLVGRQAGSFNDAKNSVIPVPPAPEKVDPLAAFLTPGALVTYQQQLNSHNAAAQHNADVMRVYENASVYNMNLPDSYGSITDDQAEIRVAQATTPPVGPDDAPDQPGPGTGGPRPPTGDGGQPGGAGSGSRGPDSRVPSNGLPPQGTASSGTTPGGYTPPAPGFRPDVPSVPVGGGSGPEIEFAGTTIGQVGLPGDGTGSGGRAGIPGAAGGVGSRTGAGPLNGLEVTQTATTRSNPTGHGGLGGAPMGMGAGGRGRGGEDEERQRASFLEEPDPEAIFGTDERTPPPVIGG